MRLGIFALQQSTKSLNADNDASQSSEAAEYWKGAYDWIFQDAKSTRNLHPRVDQFLPVSDFSF